MVMTLDRILELDEDGQGLYLNEVAPREILEIRTRNRTYRLENRGEGRALISGHPQFCPSPVEVKVRGSTWGGSVLKVGFIGRGMSLEYSHPKSGTVTTSTIEEVIRPNSQARPVVKCAGELIPAA